MQISLIVNYNYYSICTVDILTIYAKNRDRSIYIEHKHIHRIHEYFPFTAMLYFSVGTVESENMHRCISVLRDTVKFFN